MEGQARAAPLIGAIFVDMGVITDDQLDAALEQQRETGQLIGEILVARFGVSRLSLASALAEQRAEQSVPDRGEEDEEEGHGEPETEVTEAAGERPVGASDDAARPTVQELNDAIVAALAPLRADIGAVEACLESLRSRLDALEQHEFPEAADLPSRTH